MDRRSARNQDRGHFPFYCYENLPPELPSSLPGCCDRRSLVGHQK